MSTCYLDTSALAKRYLDEERSDEVDEFLGEQTLLLITPLVRTEMRSLFARRRRMKELDATLEMQLYSTFVDDIRQGYFIEHDVSARVFEGATNLIAQLPSIGIRTLDALHLAAAQQLGADLLVTADATMRDAARELGLATQYFGPATPLAKRKPSRRPRS